MQATTEWTWKEERGKFMHEDGELVMSPGPLAFTAISGALREINDGVWEDARKAAADRYNLSPFSSGDADYVSAVAQLMGELEDVAGPEHDERIAVAANIAHEALSYL
jgi:hypothetical protein